MIIIKTDKIKDIANKVAISVDGERTSPISELLELELNNKNLTLKTTNKEYFFKTTIKDVTNTDEYFHVTIVADTFLTLITKTTSNEIKFEIVNNNLVLYGNGKYTFPLVLDNDQVVVLPEIEFKETGNEIKFEIDGNILKSIYEFNSRELNKEVAVDPIQKYYYLDNKGALTFVEGACISEFEINTTPFKLLLNERLVQLFKLFSGQKVNVTILKEATNINTDDSQVFKNKIKFTIEDSELIAILPDSDLVEKYPSIQIRALANIDYPGQVIISKTLLLEALDRLSIFNRKGSSTKVDLKKCGQLDFSNDSVKIISLKDQNSETISYLNGSLKPFTFTSYVSLSDLTKHGNISLNDSIILYYGTGDAIMMQRKNLKQVIPELGDPTEYISSLGD